MTSTKTWAKIVEQSTIGHQKIRFDIINKLMKHESAIARRIFANFDETSLFTAALVDPNWFKLARPFLLRLVYVYFKRIDDAPFHPSSSNDEALNWRRMLEQFITRGSAPDLVIIVLALKEMISKQLKEPDVELFTCKIFNMFNSNFQSKENKSDKCCFWPNLLARAYFFLNVPLNCLFRATFGFLLFSFHKSRSLGLI